MAAQRLVACVAGVNGEGEGEREKNGVLRSRDEGTLVPSSLGPSPQFFSRVFAPLPLPRFRLLRRLND